MTNRVALVTGASSGIGAATATALARRGYRVVVQGRDEAALAEVAARVNGVPGVVATPFFERRGTPYSRRWPRPVPPARVADAVLRCVESGRAEVYVPRWLRVPVAVQAVVPGAYRWLEGRLG